MQPRILIIDGHPDPAPQRFLHALAEAYRDGAAAARHEVRCVRIADLNFSLLRTQSEYEHADPPENIRRCQAEIDWATHVVILYPLWLGAMPAVLKGWLEQVLRPGFAFSTLKLGRWPVKLQRGKSARVIVTMGMPAFIYRWFYRAHSVRSLRRNILKFVGFGSVRATLIGSVGTMGSAKRNKYLDRVRALGARAA